MTTDRPFTGIYGPMPEPGAQRVCWFCSFVVTLTEAPRGGYYWTAAKDRVDGGRHCTGGKTSANVFDTIPRTYHLPLPELDELGNVVGERWAYWYTSEGIGRTA